MYVLSGALAVTTRYCSVGVNRRRDRAYIQFFSHFGTGFNGRRFCAGSWLTGVTKGAGSRAPMQSRRFWVIPWHGRRLGVSDLPHDPTPSSRQERKESPESKDQAEDYGEEE